MEWVLYVSGNRNLLTGFDKAECEKYGTIRAVSVSVFFELQLRSEMNFFCFKKGAFILEMN